MSDHDDDETAPGGPDPAARPRPRTSGTPLTLSDGRPWTLADFMPSPGEPWDRLYDQNVLRGRYRPADLRVAAVMLLMTAHPDLRPDDAVELVRGVEAERLVPAVEAALFGANREQTTFSDWVEMSLALAGLDSDHVAPARRLPIALALEAAGRCPPRHEYITAAKQAARRAEVMQLARETARPTPAP